MSYFPVFELNTEIFTQWPILFLLPLSGCGTTLIIQKTYYFIKYKNITPLLVICFVYFHRSFCYTKTSNVDFLNILHEQLFAICTIITCHLPNLLIPKFRLSCSNLMTFWLETHVPPPLKQDLSLPSVHRTARCMRG